MNAASPLLAMRAISKSFPGVRALTEVDIALAGGEVLGIVGENGAGKSTLMKVLAGVISPDEGEITLEGAPFAPRNPRDALRAGIIVIHQELSLVPDRSIAHNIFLGNLPRGPLGNVKCRMLNERARVLLGRVGLSVNPATPVRALGIAQQQLVEIARALSREARVIVLDEPTATLTATEKRTLFASIAGLRAAGVGLIYISHHLDEIFHVCDRVTVLRDGRAIRTAPTAEWDERTLIQAMVNRPIEALFPTRGGQPGEVLLSVEGLSSPGLFSDVSFEVRAGEVLGLGGLIGAGRTEVLKTIFGALPASAGAVRVDGDPKRMRSPREALAHGIALVPEDRKGEGLIMPFPISSNLALSRLHALSGAGIVVNRRRVDALATDTVGELRIRTSGIRQRVMSLSGGNQQKVVIGRALTTKPRVFLLDEPTRGIDVGAKIEVYRLINELAERGSAVIVVSSDMLELLGMCDRIVVMRSGRVTGTLNKSEFSQERVMSLAALG